MSILHGRIHPNGEFGIGIVKKLKPEKFVAYENSKEPTWEENGIRVHGVLATIRAVTGHEVTECGLPLVPGAPTKAIPLDLTQDSNSHSRARGMNGISGYGRKLVRNTAELLQGRFGMRHLSFLTLTVPSISLDEWRRVCSSWSEILRVFNQWLTRSLLRAGLPEHLVGVTEIQSKRLERSGEPGLHYHCIFVGRKKGKTWAISPLEIRNAWKRVLSSAMKGGGDDYYWGNCENCVSVKTSAAAYLGKYMSKGSSSVASVRELWGDECIPSSWYSCTARMRRAFRKSIEVLSDVAAREVLRVAEAENGNGGFIGYVCLPGDSGEVVVGWYGRLSRRAMRVLGLGESGRIRGMKCL